MLPDKSWRAYQSRLQRLDDSADDRWWLSALGVMCMTAALMLALVSL